MGKERKERPNYEDDFELPEVMEEEETDLLGPNEDLAAQIENLGTEQDLPVDVPELIRDTAPDVVLEEDQNLKYSPYSGEFAGEDIGESFLAIDADTNADEAIEEIERHTLDDDIVDEFADRQRLAYGSDELALKVQQNQLESPEIAADDIDAAWEYSAVGEELPGGSVATPDQDIVDEIGAAVGLTYEDNEPLRGADKVEARDQDRWELNPASDDGLDDWLDDDLDEDEVLYGADDADEEDDWLEDEDLGPYAEDLNEIDAQLEEKDR